MRDSPRTRRLRSDLRSLEALRADSSILDFQLDPSTCQSAPEAYLVRFRGRGLWRPEGTGEVMIREAHEVLIRLGAAYPRMMPELSWRSPIFHPNISASGIVCIGGYGTHWVPSLQLDELCHMLWDMLRYENFDTDSPYNREAAHWVKHQKHCPFPVDPRPLRDRVAGLVPDRRESRRPPISSQPINSRAMPDVLFLDESTIIDAEVVEPEPEILFIE